MAVKLVLSVLTLIEVSAALEWTSAGSLQNGTTIPACPGQDVTLPWSFSTAAAEHLTNVEWHYTPQGGSEVLLATQAFGTFLASPTASLHLEFIPNAGIRLHNVAIADTGTYSVHVNINLHGSLITEVQTVDVHVSDDPLTTNGQLHVKMLPDAVYDNSTQQYSLQLACGEFKPEWGPKVSVLWKTPSNETLSSTFNENGHFLLSVPHPVVSGDYTCNIDDTSPASLCVQSGSPLQRGATLSVDGIQAQMTLLESKMKFFRESQDKEIASLKQENAQLRQDLQTLKGVLRNPVSFDGHLYSKVLTHGEILHADGSTTNSDINSAFSSGVFSVPVSGTYIFLATIATRIDSNAKTDNVVDLMVDGQVMSKCYTSYKDHVEQGNCHAIVRLKVGQRVWLQNYYEMSKYYNDGGVSTFSGALLHPELP